MTVKPYLTDVNTVLTLSLPKSIRISKYQSVLESKNFKFCKGLSHPILSWGWWTAVIKLLETNLSSLWWVTDEKSERQPSQTGTIQWSMNSRQSQSWSSSYKWCWDDALIISQPYLWNVGRKMKGKETNTHKEPSKCKLFLFPYFLELAQWQRNVPMMIVKYERVPQYLKLTNFVRQ